MAVSLVEVPTVSLLAMYLFPPAQLIKGRRDSDRIGYRDVQVVLSGHWVVILGVRWGSLAKP